MKKADLLKEALGIVEKRGLSYGKPENNFRRIAELWEIYINQRESQANVFIAIGETDVAALMVLMKVARLMEKPDRLDSWLDIAGYAACGAEVSRAGENTEQTLDEWLGTDGDPGDETGLSDEVIVSPSGVDIHPTDYSRQVNVQSQKRELKIGDPVISKRYHEVTWRGTVEAIEQTANGTIAQVRWTTGDGSGREWRTRPFVADLEIAAVPS